MSGSEEPPPMEHNQDDTVAAIEPDTYSDEGYDTASIASDLTSLKSSVMNYEYENGRRYHGYQAGKYMLPNDDKEQERLDVLHHVFRLTLGGALCRTAPELNDPDMILDIGTGTGIWAVDMGDEFPSAEIIGTDLSPIQSSWIDDATQEWAFPPDSFDFIHARGLAGSIRDWPELLRQAYIHLKPGGRIELSEGRPHMCCDDNTYSEDSATYKWVSEFYRISRGAGLEFDMFPQYSDLLKNAGFVNVQTDEKPTPIGTWPKNKRLKQIGLFFEHQFLEGAVDGYSLALFTRLGGWSEAETQVLLAQAMALIPFVLEALMLVELASTYMLTAHSSYATAQKPLAS
ncbi:hypothetical protein LTS03_009624 [Exophiala xenobiotica]|nr:hypothetical protein LTR41_011305 [Exophiala xenobiotica]KAK5246501.1 hypothetical protein LTS06_008235 [Exophiala xenobiotica]KAK5362236.1 hypothetical protein LTR11_009628 [Exophiala xenobiotica]KAK5363893.1 hypothetical protein LTS03_009624 [Exophiala xenobiotica]